MNPRWLPLLAGTGAAGILAGAAGIPSPALFAALLCGLAWALLGGAELEPAPPLVTAAMAVIGASIGTYFRPEALTALGGHWIGVALVVGATLAFSLLLGVALSAWTGLDRPTALLGSIAGGASGIIGIADELGADGRLVAVMQFVRVVVVVLVAPVAGALIAGGAGGPAGTAGGAGHADLLFTAGVCAGGLALARVVPFPAATLLAPMAVSALVAGLGPVDDPLVPGWVQALAFAVIGLQVGLRFTTATVRAVGRLMAPLLVSIAALIAACAGLAGLLVAAADVPFLDAYLATTPGGMYAVLATAVGSGADATFVLAVQALRLLVMLAAAPLLARLILRR